MKGTEISPIHLQCIREHSIATLRLPLDNFGNMRLSDEPELHESFFAFSFSRCIQRTRQKDLTHF